MTQADRQSKLRMWRNTNYDPHPPKMESNESTELGNKGHIAPLGLQEDATSPQRQRGKIVCGCERGCECVGGCVCMYVCMCVRGCECMYVYMYVCGETQTMPHILQDC